MHGCYSETGDDHGSEEPEERAARLINRIATAYLEDIHTLWHRAAAQDWRKHKNH